MWITVLRSEPPHCPLQSIQLPQISGTNILLVSEESSSSDPIPLDHLTGCGAEKLRERREAAADANVLENGNELFVILSVDLC